jgi:hypothetical protein
MVSDLNLEKKYLLQPSTEKRTVTIVLYTISLEVSVLSVDELVQNTTILSL